MKVTIKRIDKDLPLPRHETAGSVAVDLIIRETATFAPGESILMPANIIVATPPGYMFMIAPRSSLSRKKHLAMRNSIGIIDQDYRGPDDEVHVLLYNFGDTPVTIERGERVAQGIFVKIEQVEWDEVEKIDAPSRGRFGSTGGYAGT